MLNLRSPTASPTSSPTKKIRKINCFTNVHAFREERKFLENLALSLTKGINAVDDTYFAAERERYIATNTDIFNELRSHESSFSTGGVAIDLANTTLYLYEKKEGVKMVMYQDTTCEMTALLPGEKFRSLINNLSHDASHNDNFYEKTFSTYVGNVANYGENFSVYHKAYTKGLNKAYLYLSTKNEGLIRNFNDEVPISNRNRNYNCRDFSAHVAYSILKDPFGKIDWNLFENAEAISKTIPGDISQIYNAFKKNASNTSLVEHEQLGEHIKTCFNQMNGVEQVRVLLVETTSSTMLIRLRIKGTTAKPIYVMNFYNPDMTNASLRCETKLLYRFDSHTLEKYMNGRIQNGPYHNLLAKRESVVLVTECRLDSLNPTSINHPKKISDCIPSPITPTHMYFLLADNFYEDLAGLKDQLREVGEQSPERLVKLLSAKSNNGKPGLYAALEGNQTESVRAFGKLINDLQDLIPEDKRVELIAAKRSNGVPGLYTATRCGSAKATSAWCETLPLISNQADRVELLSGATRSGTSATCLALYLGDKGALQIQHEVLSLVSDDNTLATLILNETPEGLSGICYALEGNKIASIQACKAWTDTITNLHKRNNLIATIIRKTLPSVRVAEQKGYTEIVAAFRELFQYVPDEAIQQKHIADFQKESIQQPLLQDLSA